jgi:acyl-coenzyme A synthetase/AMP-(fatty) acid ligase
MQENLVWHETPFAKPDADRVHEALPLALARACRLWPEQTAVLHETQHFSFQDLACRAAGLAQEIQASGSAPGPVALLQSVGFDAVAAWFACAMAGRPFLLLEPGHPPHRLLELIESAACTLLLCDGLTLTGLPSGLAVRTMVSDGRSSELNLGEVLGAEEPAMIFPTSGSTGSPKLVTYSAATLQAKVQASIALMQVPLGARVLIAGSHGNYGFLHHAMVFLLSGGTLCLADIKKWGFSAASDAILRLEARHVRFTPSMFRNFAILPDARDILGCLDAVRFSGEPLLTSDLELARKVLNPNCLIQNVYGSTESALFICHCDDTEPVGATVPMGQIYPFSAYALRPIDEGSTDTDTGELLIRSSYQALGDWKLGGIDSERFPLFAPGSPERLYATGDLVRRLPDGQLLHLGRIGRMAKIRGQRVYLSEVENHLRSIPGVTGAAVIEHEESGNSQLYGFITRNEICHEDPRKWLAHRLPDFMVPVGIEVIETIPLLAGGKVDYKALTTRIPRHEAINGDKHEGKNAYEHLCHLWDVVLWPGAHQHPSDFVALGGDSLKLMQLMLHVEKSFKKSFSVDEFLVDASLYHLARLIGIDNPAPVTEKHQGLRFRLVWPSSTASKGVALAVPGWGGSAMAVPFARAGLFSGHDLWAADISLPGGNILQGNSWWKTAIEIANQIKAGALPRPRIIFGYSAGGSVAWLVGRLLAAAGCAPDYVLMSDSSPLHRLPAYGHRDLRRLLAASPAERMPAVIHVRRTCLAQLEIGRGNAHAWMPEDNLQFTFDIPTVDHSEMSRSEVLALAAPAVESYLSEISPASRQATSSSTPQTVGAEIYQMLHQTACGNISQLNKLVKHPDLGKGHLGALLQLTLRDCRTEPASTLVSELLLQHPDSLILQLAKSRLRRQPSGLCPGFSPFGRLRSIAALERMLAAHHMAFSNISGTGPSSGLSPLNIAHLFVDLVKAVVNARSSRLSKRSTR